MRRAVQLALAGLLFAAVACDNGERQKTATGPNEVSPGSTAKPSDDRQARCQENAETDLSKEPAYSANYLHRFRNSEGCEVRLDVMMYRKPGPDHHCAPWPPEIVIVNPAGVPFTPRPFRIYVRDPDGSWRDPSLPSGFDGELVLPGNARDTGYSSDAGRLFVVPEDDAFVYVVSGEATERWPRQKAGVGCV